MLAEAAQRTAYQVEEMPFDPFVFHRFMGSHANKLIYAHVDQSQTERVRALLNTVGERAGHPTIPPGMQLQDNTVIVGHNLLLTMRADETSVEYLASVMDPSRIATSCHLCYAPSRYINTAQTRQCMKCVSRICRACVACLIGKSVTRVMDLGAAHIRAMSKDELDNELCPRCPSCNEPRLGDLIAVRTKIMAMSKAALPQPPCVTGSCVTTYRKK